MVTIEVDIKQKDIIEELKQLFPECDYYEDYSSSGADVAVICVALIASLAGSKVLVQYLKNKLITIKVGKIEYTGLAENLPLWLKEKCREEKT